MVEPTRFEEGKSYGAEFQNWCYYKGCTNYVGTGSIPAKCIKRTECYATFEVKAEDGQILVKKGRIAQIEGGEMVYLKNNGKFKDLYISTHRGWVE